MDELLWFSLPGVAFVLSVVMCCPSIIEKITEGGAVSLVFLIPSIGFIIHETYRICFEKSGGFARKDRKVVDYIIELAKNENISLPDRWAAFLIWEITFYSTGFPKEFLNHDRAAWHYILAFRGIATSAILSALICLSGFLFFAENKGLALIGFLGEIITFGLMCIKSKQTFSSLMEQEVFVVRANKEIFIKTLKNVEEKQL